MVYLFACSNGDAYSTWDGTITDSAGVTVISNTTQGMWEENDTWSVQQNLVIGQTEGNAHYQFGQIPGIGVAADGRFLGVVTLPLRFEPMIFNDADIYGVWRDELNVEYVVRLKILMH